jgi:hypothetical protein
MSVAGQDLVRESPDGGLAPPRAGRNGGNICPAGAGGAVLRPEDRPAALRHLTWGGNRTIREIGGIGLI